MIPMPAGESSSSKRSKVDLKGGRRWTAGIRYGSRSCEYVISSGIVVRDSFRNKVLTETTQAAGSAGYTTSHKLMWHGEIN